MNVRAPLRPSKQKTDVQIVTAKNGLPVPVVNGKSLHSRYDPMEEARRWVSDMLSKRPDARAVVVLGLGFAYHIKALRERLPNAPIVVLEPVAEIVGAYAKSVGKNIDDVQLWPAPSPQQTVDAVAEVVSPTLVNHTLILAHPPSLALSSDGYKQIFASIQSTLDLIAMSLTTGWGFGFEWINNAIHNLRHLPRAPFLSHVLKKFQGQRPPTLVIGAGPSLNRQWDVIRRAGTLNLAADTALEPMEREGLYPHLAFSLDSQIENAQLLDAVDARNVNLAVSLEVQPSVFERPWRNLIVCSCDNGVLSWIERRLGFVAGSVKQGGSVVTCAFDFARQVESSTIYFAGVDLSFKGHTVYCRGTAYERKAVESGGRIRPVEQTLYLMKTDRTERAVFGRQTQDNLYNYYRWLKDEIGRTPCPVALLDSYSLLAEFLPSDGAVRIINEPRGDWDRKCFETSLPPNAVIDPATLREAATELGRKLREFIAPENFSGPDRLEEALQATDIRDVIESVTEPAIAVSRYERQKGGSDSRGILDELRDKLGEILKTIA